MELNFLLMRREVSRRLRNKMTKKIVVFAGNECVKAKEKYYFSLAYKTGKLLAENKFITVTGGGPGLMNEVMRGAFENGGETIGIRLNVPGRKHSEFVTKSMLFDNLNKRQEELLRIADGFISLPGGIGTFYEVFAVLALKRKQELDKNIPLLLVGGYYDRFENLMKQMYEEEFAESKIKSFYTKVETIEETLKEIKNYFNK